MAPAFSAFHQNQNTSRQATIRKSSWIAALRRELSAGQQASGQDAVDFLKCLLLPRKQTKFRGVGPVRFWPKADIQLPLSYFRL
jgi:hypothetical protein